MKGFLAGYKIKQGTANGVYLNFTMRTNNATFFTVDVSIHSDSVV